ncbi:MAG: class I SAM-dependent methyltransferase [Candidatus Thorarchaeota archaeon]
MTKETPDDLESGYEGVGEYYDLFADNSDIPFFLDYAIKVGAPILDLAAGTGRVSFALAQEGFEVVALERSKSMLAVARKKQQVASKEVAKRVQLVEGTMKDFSLGETFPLILVPNSFGHLLTRDDQLSMLRCVKKHLSADGLFILDLYPGEHQYEQAKFEDAPAKLPDGRIVTRYGEITSDFEKQLMRVNLRYLVKSPDGEIIDEINVVSGASLLFQKQVDDLIQTIGFQIEDEFGDFEKNPFTPDSGRRIFILKK